MAQAKLLYVVTATGELTMSEIAHRLGVTISTASGAVDHLCRLGLLAASTTRPTAARSACRSPPRTRDARADARARHAPAPRAASSASSDDDLAVIERAIRILIDHRAVASVDPTASARDIPREHPMSRLTQLAVGRRSVTLLLAAALFIAGILAWGSLKQELLPDVSFPIVSVIAPYPGAGASDVTEQVAKPIERAMSGVPGLTQLQSTSANSLAFVVAQFDYGTDLDEAIATIEENLRSAPLPRRRRADRRRVQLQRRAGRRRLRLGQGRDRPRSRPPRSPGPRSSPSSSRSLASPRRTSPAASRTGSSITLDPANLAEAGVSIAADRRGPPGQQPDPARRPAAGRRRADPGLDDRPVRFDRADRGPRRRRRAADR